MATRGSIIAIVALCAWQLLVLWPLVVPFSCADASARDRVGQMIGFNFGLAMMTVIILGVLTAIAIGRRHRLAVLASFAALSFGILAAGALTFVPRLRDLFKAFGADLPMPTIVLLDYHGYLLAVFVACVGLLVHAIARRQRSERQMKIELYANLAMLILANLALSAMLTSAYLPALTMCRAV